MKTVKIIGVLLSLCTIGVFFWVYASRRGLERTDFRGLSGKMLAPVMRRLVISVSGATVDAERPEFPEVLVRANRIGQEAQKLTELPATSKDLSVLEPRERVDPWDNFFCLGEKGPNLAVVSPGARHSLRTCADLIETADTITGPKYGFLYVTPSDALIVFLARHATKASGESN